MCQSRRITPGRYKRTRRQSKAVGSTGVDSGQLLEVIKAFEPESRSRPPFVWVYFDSGPPREPRKLSSSQLENEAEGKRERERESEVAQICQILVHLLNCRPGHHV